MIQDIISKIEKAKNVTEIFSNLNNWQAEYRKYSIQIHPDVCKLKGANDAFIKLNSYKEELEKGKTHTDDAGNIVYKINKCSITGNKNVLQYSISNFNLLKSFKEKIDIDFQRYIPLSAELTTTTGDIDFQLNYTFNLRSIPLCVVGTLPQCHVNWILSRMLEFCAYIYQKGYSHSGINPESVYIEPLNHGINVISFYHMTKLGSKLSTASGKHLYMYPEHIRTNKIATPDIDVELCKRTAIYLLGDKSGIGTCLRKTHSLPFLDFINKQHKNAIDAFLDFRTLLTNHFERKFIPLNI